MALPGTIAVLTLFVGVLAAETPLAEATRLNNQAARFYAEEKFAEAERVYLAALAIHCDDGLAVASIASNLGALYRHLDRYEESERRFRQALDLRRKLLAPERIEVVRALHNLAGIYRVEGRYWEARNLARAAVEGLERSNPRSPEMPAMLINLGVLERYLDGHDQAERLLRTALSLEQEVGGPRSEVAAIASSNLAKVLEDARDYGQAGLLYSSAVEALENLGPRYSGDLALVLTNWGRMQGILGHFEEDKQAQARALALAEVQPSRNEYVCSDILLNTGELLAGEGRAAESLGYFHRALALKEKILGPEHPTIADILFDYAAAARRAGRKSQADKLAKRAEELVARQERADPARLSVSAKALRNVHY